MSILLPLMLLAAAPQADATTCDLPSELATWTQPATGPGPRVNRTQNVRAALPSEMGFAMPPQLAATPGRRYNVTVRIPVAGNYVVAVNQAVEVAVGNPSAGPTPIASSGDRTAPACAGIATLKVFALPAGPLQFYFAGAADPDLRFLVATLP